MQGRVEHKLKIEKSIQNKLGNMPSYVRDYYYNISVDKEPRSCEEYVRQIKHFLDYMYINSNLVSNEMIQHITEKDISKYFHSIEIIKTKTGEQKESSFTYRRGIWFALNSFFKYLTDNGYIKKNPVSVISIPRNFDKTTHELVDMTDFNLVLDAVKNGVGSQSMRTRAETWKERDMLVFVILMTTGMRETALTEINVNDMNYDTMTFTVIDKRHKTHEYTINPAIMSALEEWLPKREMILNGKKEDALIISTNRQRISQEALADITMKYTKSALGKALSPHKFRAAFCSILYEQKGDVEYVRDAVGHSSIETTKRYIVKKQSARKEAENFMANNLNIV